MSADEFHRLLAELWTRPYYFKLVDKVPVPIAVSSPPKVEDSEQITKAFDRDRRVADDLVGPYRVSTVFLVIDHDFSFKGPPVLFETMVFGRETDYQDRYCTWDAAVAGHTKAVKLYRRKYWLGLPLQPFVRFGLYLKWLFWD